MRFDAGTRSRVFVDMALDIDPTASTIELQVDEDWYPATWQGSPISTTVDGKPKWTQTAQTTGYFAGPDATAGGATVLDTGRHLTQTRVTTGTTELVEDSSPIDVK